MYKNILVTLETTPTDRAIIDHIKQLAILIGSQVVLLHVATSAAAQWNGPNAGGEEVYEDSGVVAGLAHCTGSNSPATATANCLTS